LSVVLASFVQFSEAIYVTILGGVGSDLERTADGVTGGKKRVLSSRNNQTLRCWYE